MRNQYFTLPHVVCTESEDSPRTVCSRERALRLAKDPVAAADYFEYCVCTTFRYLFGWDYVKNKSSENGGILGRLCAFYRTSELTDRGCFHGHFLIWLLGGMNPSDVHEKLRGDSAYQHRFFEFVESIIHHELPNVDVQIDSAFNPHSETTYSTQDWRKTCY
jgi:hypothetical protein